MSNAGETCGSNHCYAIWLGVDSWASFPDGYCPYIRLHQFQLCRCLIPTNKYFRSIRVDHRHSKLTVRSFPSLFHLPLTSPACSLQINYVLVFPHLSLWFLYRRFSLHISVCSPSPPPSSLCSLSLADIFNWQGRLLLLVSPAGRGWRGQPHTVESVSDFVLCCHGELPCSSLRRADETLAYRGEFFLNRWVFLSQNQLWCTERKSIIKRFSVILTDEMWCNVMFLFNCDSHRCLFHSLSTYLKA